MISRKELEMMKDESFQFNLGRGGLVDKESVYEALVNVKIRGCTHMKEDINYIILWLQVTSE